MSKLAKALTAAAGNAAGESLYVEDVFSTYLYEGNGSTQSIDNGIDLDGEGGLVWLKDRSFAFQHRIYDTERGATESLSSNDTSAEFTISDGLTSFNSDGFSLGGSSTHNRSGSDYASWTFRKAEKFFDVVTWTGDGVTGREIAHNLGSAPAVIIIKSVSFANNWLYNHNFGASGYDLLYLDLTNSKSSQTYASGAIQAQPTDSSFTLKNSSSVNGDGNTYVAYLFASDAGGFGDDGSENIIKCGSFSGGIQDVDLGFEPQFLIYKRTDSTGGWAIFDVMRGMTADGVGEYLQANTSDAEASGGSQPSPIANGFRWNYSPTGETYIYIAIRRPMKTPESGTEVFAIDTAVDSSTNPSGKSFDSGFPVDMFLNKEVDQSYNNALYSRLTNKGLRTNTTDSEFNMGGTNWDSNIAVYQTGSTNTNNYGWMFKRAKGFMDVVAYSGTGSAHTEDHNLGVTPEMMIVKSRSDAFGWHVYVNGLGNTKAIRLDQNGSSITSSTFWNNTSPTSANFTVGTFSNINSNGSTFIAYLFATLAGVSKVGSYTGTGSNVDVDCGFSAGARFILIKRTDSTGDWYVWDSERGIVAGNDPYLLLNSTAAEVTSTDYIDPLSSGFTVTSSAPAALNASGGTYIFLAIA